MDHLEEAKTPQDSISNEYTMVVHRINSSNRSIQEIEFNMVGLTNPANFCYMNVWLQMLLSWEEIAQYYINFDTEKRTKQAKMSGKRLKFSTMFSDFTKEVLLSDLDGSVYDPVELQMAISHVFSEEMQDSHEFLLYLLSKLQNEENSWVKTLREKAPSLLSKQTEGSTNKAKAAWADYQKSHSSIVGKLFIGLSSTKVVRKCCKRVTHNYEPFIDLSIEPLHSDLNECISDHFWPLKMSMVSKYKWDYCKNHTKVTISK